MAYDRDGAVGVYWRDDNNVVTSWTAAQLVTLNDESTSGIQLASDINYHFVFLFPQLRDLVGYFISVAPNRSVSAGVMETSADTTTGQDGTWTTVANPYALQEGGAASPEYRTSINSVSATGIKALRFNITGVGGAPTPQVFHLYGDITAGSEGDSLQLWNPTTDVRLSGSALDFGDVPCGNVSQKQFRIKNRSATKTANNVVVGVQALTDTTPSVPGQHQFSLDGSTWSSTVTVTSIAPGAISPVIYVRRSTSSSAALSVWAARITGVAGSWT